MGNLVPLVGDALEPLRRARQAADECELPLMMHISFGPPTIEEVLPFLKPGDVLTHCFTGHAMKIVDDDGRLLDVARRARESGVIFDVGHGTGSFSFEIAEAVMGAGWKPDVISTDLHQLSVNGPTFDLPTTLSKFLHLGMSLPEVIEAATIRSAQVLGLDGEVGTLRPGSRADVALFRLLEGSFPLQDIHGTVREAGRLMRNTVTLVGGRELERMPLPPRRAVDGRADLAGRADPVHREAAGAARAGAHARRDGRRGRGADPVTAAYADRPIADLLDLSGRVALVTGAAQGFGFACARRLADAGAAVLLTDRRADRLEAAAARLAEHGDADRMGRRRRVRARRGRRAGRDGRRALRPARRARQQRRRLLATSASTRCRSTPSRTCST